MVEQHQKRHSPPEKITQLCWSRPPIIQDKWKSPNKEFQNVCFERIFTKSTVHCPNIYKSTIEDKKKQRLKMNLQY